MVRVKLSYLQNTHLYSTQYQLLFRYLSEAGLARCEAVCKERKLKLTAKNVEKIALDVSKNTHAQSQY